MTKHISTAEAMINEINRRMNIEKAFLVALGEDLDGYTREVLPGVMVAIRDPQGVCVARHTVVHEVVEAYGDTMHETRIDSEWMPEGPDGSLRAHPWW